MAAPQPSGGTWSPGKEFQPETGMPKKTEHFPITEGRKRKTRSDFAIYNVQLIQIRGWRCRLPGADYVELRSQLAF